MNLSKIGKVVSTALEHKNSVQIYRHIEGLKIDCEFDDTKESLLLRYKLTATLNAKSDGKTVCVIMQNPSYANEDISDKSVNFLEQLIFQKDIDYFKDVYKIVIVNQFAEVKTEDFIPNDNSIGKRNNSIIEQEIKNSEIIIIAWGSSNKFNNRKEFVHNILNSITSKIILTTKKHPSLGSLNKEFLSDYSEYKKIQQVKISNKDKGTNNLT